MSWEKERGREEERETGGEKREVLCKRCTFEEASEFAEYLRVSLKKLSIPKVNHREYTHT